MAGVNIQIPDELHRKAKIVSALRGITLKDYIIKALEDRVAKEKSKVEL